MTFNDIFKSSFLENVSELSILDTVIGLAVALVIGLFIFIIYKKTLTGVSILGPCRKETQVELSLTDARSIGVKAPIRESGDLEGSGACKLVGPKGEVVLEKGVIAAKRHIHMTPADAEAFGCKDKDVVSVKIDSDGRALVFGDVVVRVSPSYALAMHIDTDESNAGCVAPGTMGEVIK